MQEQTERTVSCFEVADINAVTNALQFLVSPLVVVLNQQRCPDTSENIRYQNLLQQDFNCMPWIMVWLGISQIVFKNL